jgi:hypothetical protein
MPTSLRSLFVLFVSLACACGTDVILDKGHDMSVGVTCKTACTAPDLCSTSTCDPSSGECIQKPANEGAACNGGSCVQGVCTPPANCWCAVGAPICEALGTQFLSCTSAPGDGGLPRNYDDYSNALPPHLSGPVVMDQIETYACSSHETAPEYAYQFQPATDADVTVTLTVTNPYPQDMSPPNTDLDLMVLDMSCNGVAACMNPALSGGGFQGVTRGTGNETVTFHALSTHTYYFVVDGYEGGAADFHIQLACQ